MSINTESPIQTSPPDPLPEEFADETEAGEFWDTHSTRDYPEEFETVNDNIEIRERVYE